MRLYLADLKLWYRRQNYSQRGWDVLCFRNAQIMISCTDVGDSVADGGGGSAQLSGGVGVDSVCVSAAAAGQLKDEPLKEGDCDTRVVTAIINQCTAEAQEGQ